MEFEWKSEAETKARELSKNGSTFSVYYENCKYRVVNGIVNGSKPLSWFRSGFCIG